MARRPFDSGAACGVAWGEARDARALRGRCGFLAAPGAGAPAPRASTRAEGVEDVMNHGGNPTKILAFLLQVGLQPDAISRPAEAGPATAGHIGQRVALATSV